MSSLICKKFSMALNSVASCLMRPPKDEILDELFMVQHKIMENLNSAGRWDGTLFTFGVMGKHKGDCGRSRNMYILNKFQEILRKP